MKSKLLSIAFFASIAIPGFLFVACTVKEDAGKNENVSHVLELKFTLGDLGGYTNYIVYAAWLENGDHIQNIYICKTIAEKSLTGTVLPYWTLKKYPKSNDIIINDDTDAITSATIKNNFTREFSLRDESSTKFTVYFEIDNSAMYNDWFIKTTDQIPGYYVLDQPAILYKAEVDLTDTSKTSYELELFAWTPNSNNPNPEGGSPVEDGIPVTELRYITHHKDTNGGFGDPDPEHSIARIVGNIMLSIKK